MNGNTNDQKLREFVGKNIKMFLRIEWICAITVVVGITAHFLHKTEGNYVCLPGLAVLAIIYYLLSFRPIEASNIDQKSILPTGMQIFINKIYFWGLSVASVAVLFSIFSFQGAHYITMVAIGTVSIAFAINAWYLAKRKMQLIDILFLLRIVVALLLLILITIESGERWY